MSLSLGCSIEYLIVTSWDLFAPKFKSNSRLFDLFSLTHGLFFKIGSNNLTWILSSFDNGMLSDKSILAFTAVVFLISIIF